MTPVLISIAVAGAILLGLVSFVQLLYLEALRLRSRDLPALEYFKDILEARIGLKADVGATSFSIIKHLILVVLTLLAVLIAVRAGDLTAAAVAEATATSLVVMLLATHIAPQLLYRATKATWLAPLVPLLKLLALLARPLTAVFSFLDTLASLGDQENGGDENGSSHEEDLDALIEAGADEGLIEEDDRHLIHSVVALGDKTVRQVMTPRPNMAAIRQEATIEDFRLFALDKHFSRFPVYAGSIDDIRGIIHVRDILGVEDEERSRRSVSEFVHPTLHVPETKPVADLFREMQRDHVHLAVVVDEYGETAGIATIEDVVEEVFGEIEDEYDPAEAVEEEAEGVYRLSGNLDLDHLHALVDFRPDEETESTTVGGLVSEWLGHVPSIGESVERDGIRIEVTDSDERHVEEVRVSRISEAGDEPDSGNNQ